MYDEFLRITQEHVPYNETFMESFLLQDIMATSHSQLPQHIQKDNDVIVTLPALFMLLANHPLLLFCNTSSLPGPPSTPRECIPFRLPFSFDMDRLRIESALFTHADK